MVTAHGDRIDGTLNSNGSPCADLNFEWSSAVSRTSNGWIAEIAIPFSHLPFHWAERVLMRFKAARFISRKFEEVDFPEINPDGHPHLSQFREVEFTGIDHNPTALNDLATALHETINSKKQLGMRYNSLSYDELLSLWGDASVFDYLTFPSHELMPGSHPIDFAVNSKELMVSSLFEQLKSVGGRRISNLEEFLARTLTTSFIVIQNDTVIYEKYFNGFDRESIVTSFSMAKSFLSTLVGISSLSYLTRLPLQQLKIDQSFVHNIGLKPADATIVQTIIGMAHNLGMDVIAEGVETEDQKVFLERHGCLQHQGYLFSKPVSCDEFELLGNKI